MVCENWIMAIFAGFSAQPLGDMHGSVNIDDAVFFFGKENDWKVAK